MKKIIKWLGLIFALVVLVSLFYYVRDKKSRPILSGDELLRLALIEIRQHKNYPKAIELMRQARAASPAYTDLQVTLGRAFMLNGNMDSAKITLEKAVASDKKNAQGLLYLVNVDMEKKDTSTAIKFLGQYLTFYPADSAVWLKKYGLLLQHNEFENAAETYDYYVSKFNSNKIRAISFDYFQAAANRERKAGNMEGAYANFQKAIRYESGRTEILEELVNLSLYFKNYPAALKYNQPLLEHDANNPIYLSTAASIYEKLHDKENAAIYTARAYTLGPHDPAASKDLAALYLSLAKENTGSTRMKYAGLASQLAPDNKDAMIYLVNGHLEQKQYSAALTVTDRALRQFPSDQVLIDKKIGILYEMGDYQTCANYLESVLRQNLSSHNIRAYEDLELLIATAHIKQKKWDAALAALRKGLNYNRYNQQLLEQLVNVYASQGDIPYAIAAVDTLLISNPTKETYLFKKAGLLEADHQFEKAVLITGSLYAAHPSNSQYKAAYLNELLGAEREGIERKDWDKTISFYNEAVGTGNPGYYQLLYAISAYANKNDSTHVLLLADSALHWFPGDSLFNLKKSFALESLSHFADALSVSKQLLTRFPSDTGLQQIYLDQLNNAGKYYVKQNNNDSALNLFYTAHAFAPKDTFSLMNLSAIYFVKRQYDSSIYFANTGLQLDSNNTYLLMKKASAYEQLKQYGAAYLAANRVMQLRPTASIADYAAFLKNKTYLNQAGISHINTFFSSGSRSSITGIQYMRRFKKGSITGKINYGDRPSGTGVQGGVDIYYNHDSAYYSNFYVNVASGNAFPRLQGGYSLFRNFKKGWEGELGVRYSGFDSINNYTLAASVGKYIKSSWINFRTYYTRTATSWYPSFQLTTRQYLNDKNDYLSLIGGLGTIPDDQGRDYRLNNYSGFVSKSVGIGFQKSFHYRTTMQAFFNYTNLRVSSARTINQYDIYITLLRNF